MQFSWFDSRWGRHIVFSRNPDYDRKFKKFLVNLVQNLVQNLVHVVQEILAASDALCH